MQLPQSTRKFSAATLASLLPFAVHTVPYFSWGSVWFTSTFSFFAAFLMAGALAGALLGFMAAAAAPFGYAIAMVALTKLHFIGNGGDGDLFYVLALLAVCLYACAALASAAVKRARQRSS